MLLSGCFTKSKGGFLSAADFDSCLNFDYVLIFYIIVQQLCFLREIYFTVIFLITFRLNKSN